MIEPQPRQLALISVSDKSGIVEFAHELSNIGFEIISTGGTSKTLRQAEISTKEVRDFTGFPEILEGRVKTLHPKIFGGILYTRGDPRHQTDMDKQGLQPIDCVVVNLYPFEKIHLENKIPKSEMLEFIDIGGVSLLRAAAKNFQNVIVLSDSKDYPKVIQELKEKGNVSVTTRKILAEKAFSHTAHYDSMITKYFREISISEFKVTQPSVPAKEEEESLFKEELTIGLRKVKDLRYGENPQQKAALYKESGGRDWGVVNAEVLQGKELSFNNYLDLENAWQIVNSLMFGSEGTNVTYSKSNASCVIIKHTNPCGVAIAQGLLEAFKQAFAADPLSAFGGVIGFSSTVEEDTANEIVKTFFECIIAPDYSPGALEIFKKKTNLRILRQKIILTLPYEYDIKKISGGYLMQEIDPISDFISAKDQERRKIVTKRQPTPEELYSLEFAWKVCQHVKSNAILLARGALTLGIGIGQTSRIDSLKIAIQKAGLLAEKTFALRDSKLNPANLTLPLVMASDGFFPFKDCIEEAAKVGVSAIIQPGGSIRDQESIDAANENNISMIFTGIRHFKH
ncbi:MAG: bifunctional phosphoribosylaminoimidazolecarboxamide formyltransferase/IMP cyclohydrolase [Elusimicrobia bacterium]|nr:bifunctional phosphoribosylaminoimidazolecarboxamide formyltransferase/IMP cyclohydrolase [Elusimicrobiota bacterium]